jgi:hypothetical protein
MFQNAFGNLFGSYGHKGWGAGFMGGGTMGSNPYGGWAQAPNYVNPSPVYTQQQINNQANLQRANLYANAANTNRQFAENSARSGFSPNSPAYQFMQNTNSWRAAQGAAANETNLNFNAAAANAQNILAGQQVNAGLYNDYMRALGEQQGQGLQYGLGIRGQDIGVLESFMRGLGV